MKNYKVISPPFTLNFKRTSKTELKAYYNWYLSLIPERIKILRDAVQTTPGYEKWEADFSPASLDPLGKWFSEQIKTRKRTRQEKEEIYSNSPAWFRDVEISDFELANQTFSLAIDMGMYLSQVFLKNMPGLQWLHFVKGRKDDINYGQPVLEGFGGDYFNPVHMLVTLAYGLADKTYDGRRLRGLYEIWKNLATSWVVCSVDTIEPQIL
ncbi:hypothetical protein HYR99_26840 [Candidatus Poribacteria bacterium]|nr:hypothetical protein [Candidatus Poribacteria bacterium]